MIITTPVITAAIQLISMLPSGQLWVMAAVFFGLLLRPLLLECFRAASNCALVQACPSGTTLVRVYGRRGRVVVSAAPDKSAAPLNATIIAAIPRGAS